MWEFTNEKDRKGKDYTFCYDCNYNYGDEKCRNCEYYKEE